ncbi:hypothetical protein [Georgfuchsia toluolica]|uniref:hypothetical protein n=1 Tax=Georgfuchsia toluolica TaxID=424218 RepID=UPI001C732441|nr:hypothetical protein [Georgfuchsia toluolica]
MSASITAAALIAPHERVGAIRAQDRDAVAKATSRHPGAPPDLAEFPAPPRAF